MDLKLLINRKFFQVSTMDLKSLTSKSFNPNVTGLFLYITLSWEFITFTFLLVQQSRADFAIFPNLYHEPHKHSFNSRVINKQYHLRKLTKRF